MSADRFAEWRMTRWGHRRWAAGDGGEAVYQLHSGLPHVPTSGQRLFPPPFSEPAVRYAHTQHML
eukprot:339078-Prorocentrum_lima.AAC.1